MAAVKFGLLPKAPMAALGSKGGFHPSRSVPFSWENRVRCYVIASVERDFGEMAHLQFYLTSVRTRSKFSF